MSNTQQYAISFVCLTIPSSVQAKKVILSMNIPKSEIFMKKQRTINKESINLYRESLFCPEKPSSLSFRIYEVSEAGKKTLIQEMKISSEDINSFKKQTTLFKKECNGFTLAWEGKIHSEQSEDLQSQYTDRDYSELDLPFDYDNSSEIDQELRDSPKLGQKQSSTQGSRTPENFDDENFSFEPMPSKLSRGGSTQKICPFTGSGKSKLQEAAKRAKNIKAAKF